MKKQSEDSLEQLFHNGLNNYERKAPVAPLAQVQQRLSFNSAIQRLSVFLALLVSFFGLVFIPSYDWQEELPKVQKDETTANKNSKPVTIADNQNLSATSEPTNVQPSGSMFRSGIQPTQTETSSKTKVKDELINTTPNVKKPNTIFNYSITTEDQNEPESYFLQKLEHKENEAPVTSEPVMSAKMKVTPVTPTVLNQHQESNNNGLCMQLMPMMLYNIISPNKNDELYIGNFKNESTISTNRLGLRASLYYEHQVSDRLTIQTGGSIFFKRLDLAFNTLGYEIDSVSSDVNQLPGRGFEVTTISTDSVLTENRIAISSINWGLFAGLIWKISRRHTVGVTYETQNHFNSSAKQEEELVGLNDSNFIYIDYLYEIHQSTRTSIFVRPTISYAISDRHTPNPVNVRPYGIGVGFGLRYRL